MNNITFKIVSCSDKDYVDACNAVVAANGYVCERINLSELGDVPPGAVSGHQEIMDILSFGQRVVRGVTWHFHGSWQVQITRPPENGPFDNVAISRPHQNQREELLRFAKFVAVVQEHLGEVSSNAIGIANLLGPSVKEHFEAREIALARLEKLGSVMLGEMEDARKRRELEFEEEGKTAAELKYQQKEQELQTAITQQNEKIDRRSTELDNRSKELDDRAAKHARRQHYKDIKEKFKSWSETFQVTPGTTGLRITVFWFTVFLMSLFGGLAGWLSVAAFWGATFAGQGEPAIGPQNQN